MMTQPATLEGLGAQSRRKAQDVLRRCAKAQESLDAAKAAVAHEKSLAEELMEADRCERFGNGWGVMAKRTRTSTRWDREKLETMVRALAKNTSRISDARARVWLDRCQTKTESEYTEFRRAKT